MLNPLQIQKGCAYIARGGSFQSLLVLSLVPGWELSLDGFVEAPLWSGSLWTCLDVYDASGNLADWWTL